MFIPEELKSYKQWVMWKYETRDGKVTKIPYTINGIRASSTSPKTWTDCDTARSHIPDFDGIGFVFSRDDPFIGIDWDHCYYDEWHIKPEVLKEIEKFNSYAERSPSGKGAHCICIGTIPAGSRCRSGNKEIYSHGRFFTFTGDRLINSPEHINKCCEQIIIDFINALAPPKSTGSTKIGSVSLPYKSQPTTKGEVKEIFLKCKHGEHFNKLFGGNYSDYSSHSEADFALCYLIAKHTKNPTNIDIIFRSSKLYREKWNNAYYRNRTINSAITIALTADIEEMIKDDN